MFSDYSKSSYEEALGVVIYSGKITKEDVNRGKIDFVMRMWVSDEVKIQDMNEFSNKTFAVKVNTYATSLDR